jgi:hypothetical protein
MDDLTDTDTHTKSQGRDKRQTRHNFVKISGKSIHFDGCRDLCDGLT